MSKLFIPVLILWQSCVFAGDLVDARLMLPELAQDIANAALKSCRAKGYQVAVVVVDRSSVVQVVVRDVYASRVTLELARRKANASVLSRVRSSELRRNRQDIRQELNSSPELVLLEGGVPITAGGSLIGAVGVSGAPDGTLDEKCALDAVESVAARLDFAD